MDLEGNRYWGGIRALESPQSLQDREIDLVTERELFWVVLNKTSHLSHILEQALLWILLIRIF